MRRILPLLLLMCAGMANGQIVNIPDAGFKAELLSSSSIRQVAKDFNDNWMTIDVNNDGEVQVSEALAVKALNITDMLIFSLNGLDGFSNLEELNIGNSLITTLDVSSLANIKNVSCYNMQILTSVNVNSVNNLKGIALINLQNFSTLDTANLTNLAQLSIYGTAMTSFNANGLARLTDLFFVGNRNATNVTVNGLSNLLHLNCSNNALTTLTISGLTGLIDLDCSANQLTNLNGLPNLSKLACHNNRLTSFNVGGLTNLTELNCSGNEITSLNVNSLTNLVKLNANLNKLNTLNVSGLTTLEELHCSLNSMLTSVTLSNLPNLKQFSAIGMPYSNGPNPNNLTTLDLSGLPNLETLNCSSGMLTSLNLDNLTGLKEVNCSYNQITNLNLTNLPNLKRLNCSVNPISSLDATQVTSLEELTCGNGYITGGLIQGTLRNLNVVGLANLRTLTCSYNLLSSLDLTGLVNLEYLFCEGVPNNVSQLTALNVNHLSNLKVLNCNFQQLTSLNVSNLTNLEAVYCAQNHITNLDLTNLPNLMYLDYNFNQVANANLVDLPSLQNLYCSNNYLVSLNVLNLTNLKSLNCASNQLTSLNLSGLTNLETLDFSNNQLTLSNISGLSTNLKSLNCSGNNLTDLNISGLTSLETLQTFGNQLSTLDLSTLNNLKNLDCSGNQLTDLQISHLSQLESLLCTGNQISNLNITGLNLLSNLECGFNPLSSLDVTNHLALTNLSINNTAIPNLDVNFLTNLQYYSCSSTGTNTLDVSNLTNLRQLDCSFNQLTTLDLNNSTLMQNLNCSNNPLVSLFVKNGANENELLLFNTPTLEYICVDSAQLESVQTLLNGLGMTTTVSNSYCSFEPGGNHNSIGGITIFDDDNNGCDVTDVVNPFVRLDVINNGNTAQNGATVTNINGSYNFYTDAGNYTIAPNVENPTWFDFSPASADFSFANNNNNISTQNFCISAVGAHSDIEVVYAPLEPARPGFNAGYKIVFKNKGNQMHSGTVTLNFDDDHIDFIEATPAPDNTVANSLSWNYVNLMPFENRSIVLKFELNTPMDSPALNNGDELDFSATITPVVGDELPNDNQYVFRQTVVGSYDPNSIECLEGDTVAPIEIGNYLHYAINFENLGTFYAENIVVRSEIDPALYDISSLQVMNSSHPSYTRISGNTVEFVFQDINLAAATGNPPVGGHGDVLFKIRTKSGLVENDTVLQRAGIYFDYNYPIETNDAETTFAALNNPVFEFDNTVKIYPNPTTSIIHVDSEFEITSIELYDIQGRILETHLENESKSTLDLSTKPKGIYFVKIKTEKGSKVEKIVKE
ncbi:T9SS type A sorting domain-containing protein [Flavobacterium sp.]